MMRKGPTPLGGRHDRNQLPMKKDARFSISSTDSDKVLQRMIDEIRSEIIDLKLQNGMSVPPEDTLKNEEAQQ